MNKRGENGEVFSCWRHRGKIVNAIFGAFTVLLVALAVVALSAGRDGVSFVCVCALAAIVVLVCWLALFYQLHKKRVVFYSDRVLFLNEALVGVHDREAKYSDIRGACINLSDEEGDHLFGGSFRIAKDTLCVYCTRGEYILFSVHGWGRAYARRILEEILSRAGVEERVPEAGEYGAGSAAAEEVLRSLGLDEEREEEFEEECEDSPSENRFDLEVLTGCELVTERAVRLGLLVRVLPGKTDVWIVEKDGTQMLIPAVEGLVLDMDAGKNQITVDADIYFREGKKQE